MTKKTRYFMAGSAAVVVAGLCTGLVAYYGGGFQALSASTGPTELALRAGGRGGRGLCRCPGHHGFRAPAAAEDRRFRAREGPGGVPERRRVSISSTTSTTSSRAMVPGRAHDRQVAASSWPAAGSTSSSSRALPASTAATVEEYSGKRLVTSPATADSPTLPGRQPHPQPRPPSMTIAFLEPGLVAVGESAAVKHAIDAQMSAQSITSNNEMMELVSDIERRTTRGRSAVSTS